MKECPMYKSPCIGDKCEAYSIRPGSYKVMDGGNPIRGEKAEKAYCNGDFPYCSLLNKVLVEDEWQQEMTPYYETSQLKLF